jgi:hypothetical protein
MTIRERVIKQTISDIVGLCCAQFGVKQKDLMTKRGEVTIARYCIIYYLFDNGFSTSEILRFIDCKYERNYVCGISISLKKSKAVNGELWQKYQWLCEVMNYKYIAA